LPISGVLATVLLERIFDMCTILLLFGLSVLQVSVSEQVRTWGLMMTGLAAGTAGIIVLIRWREEAALKVVRAMCDRMPEAVGEGVNRFVIGFVKALEILDSPKAFLRAFAWSLYLWLVIAFLNALGLAAFHLPLSSTIVVTCVVAIAVSVPSAPGYIGSFQLGCVLALAIFAVTEGDAIAFSVVHHVVQFIAIVGAGLYSLWTENMSLRQVESVAA
jgi:uncharacterized protein (TIRG00374 family)